MMRFEVIWLDIAATPCCHQAHLWIGYTRQSSLCCRNIRLDAQCISEWRMLRIIHAHATVERSSCHLDPFYPAFDPAKSVMPSRGNSTTRYAQVAEAPIPLTAFMSRLVRIDYRKHVLQCKFELLYCLKRTAEGYEVLIYAETVRVSSARQWMASTETRYRLPTFVRKSIDTPA